MSDTATTRSVWSGSELALELDSDGTRYTYLWGPGRIPLSVTEKTAAGVSTTFAYQVDAMGSVIVMTDASGAVVARYAYDPWGRVTSATGTAIAAKNPLRYRAYYTDAETGLYYMPARYYDPATARFLSADPAPPSAGDPGSLNAFAYCGDDPVNASDPTGAVSDMEAESWRHYYAATGGNRGVSAASSYRIRNNQNYRRRLANRTYVGLARARALRQARVASMQGKLESQDLRYLGVGDELNSEAEIWYGVSAIASTVAVVAGTVAIASSPSGVGPVVAGTVAGAAYVVSVVAGERASCITNERITKGYLEADDPRNNFILSRASELNTTKGSPLGPGVGLLAASCSWALAAYEWTYY